jgi:hypothetical protein
MFLKEENPTYFKEGKRVFSVSKENKQGGTALALHVYVVHRVTVVQMGAIGRGKRQQI